MEQKKISKFKIGKIIQNSLLLLFGLVAGGCMGYFFGKYLKSNDLSVKEIIFSFAVFLVSAYVGKIIQIIAHEGGHLIFGLLTGYKFCSFRIGSFMWTYDGEKVKFSKLKLAGTSGQCLMLPPDLVDGKMPTFWYNAGGVILNIIVSLLFWMIYLLLPKSAIFTLFCIVVIGYGIIFALTNGIPLTMGFIDNDGKNIITLQKHPSAVKAFWITMKSADMLIKGARIRETPEEWYYMPEDSEMQDTLSTTIGITYAGRLIDMHKFDEALGAYEKLLAGEYAMTDLHRKLIIADVIFFNLLRGNNNITELYSKKQKKFMAQMISFPSVARTQYAIEKIINKDDKKAEKCLTIFEKIAKTYPYKGDIEIEKELLELIKKNSC